MNGSISKLSRIIAILTYLQAKRIVSAPFLAKRFNVSVRTIYRDINTLINAGNPIISDISKGYSLMVTNHLPPVMFTQDEANALITAEHFIKNNTDTSLVKNYSDALNKVRAVFRDSMKKKSEFLNNRIGVKPQLPHNFKSDTLALLQNAIIDCRLLEILYNSESKQEKTSRLIEPFALYNNKDDCWTLIAFCRLRKDFRLFRLERIEYLKPLEEKFKPHKMTLDQFINKQREKARR